MALRALIILGGEQPPIERMIELAHQSDLIIAADSGWDAARRAGIMPNLLVGDMDSINDQAVLSGTMESNVEVVVWPREKDWTDTELALNIAWERGSTHVILLGGGGGRLDHLLGIFALFQRERTPDRWYTAQDEVICIHHNLQVFLKQGTTVSFFPVGSRPCRFRSLGLKWALDGLNWKSGDCGVSNVMAGNDLQLFSESGRMLLVRQLDSKDSIIDFSPQSEDLAWPHDQ